MLAQLKTEAARTARRAGLAGGGLLCVGAGAAFLTGAAWLLLDQLAGALVAATVIGAAYLGAGLILIGLASVRTAPSTHPHEARNRPPEPRSGTTPPDAPPLMQAFLFGLQAGANADRRRP
ncbi:MAG: phage holin family protein [Rhodobacteraceae bacterium]|nr:phage holin family protein [Paracoccaceae bacterium]